MTAGAAAAIGRAEDYEEPGDDHEIDAGNGLHQGRAGRPGINERSCEETDDEDYGAGRIAALIRQEASFSASASDTTYIWRYSTRG